MARAYAKRLGGDLILIDKRRPAPNEAEVLNIIGDAKGRNILIVDDMIDTAGTFANAVKALKDGGAKEIFGACTHPLFSGKAVERVMQSAVTKVYVTDSIALNSKCQNSNKVEVLSVAALFADAIKRGFKNQSISSLFDVDKG